MADLSLRSVESSNLPVAQKSALRRLYEGTMSRSGGGFARVKMHAISGVQAVRKGSEGVVVGGILGMAEVELTGGLDYKLTEETEVPIDAALGVLGLVGSTMLAGESYAEDMANVGQSALTVFAYRKSKDYWAKRAASPKGDIGFDGYSSDRIIRAASGM